MELDLNILRPEERVSLQLRLLYEKAGFHEIEKPQVVQHNTMNLFMLKELL